MKKKLVQLTAALLTMITLTGCNLGGKNIANVPNTPANPNTPVNTTVPYQMEESVNLTEGVTGTAVTLTAPEKKDIKALSNASVMLASEIAKNEGDESNVLISPTSVFFALGMTENGATGETLKQMEKTVNGGIESGRMNGIMAYTSDKMRKNEDVSWNVANSVWFKDDGQLQMREDFLNAVVSYYRSEIYKAPFDETTLKDINGWVNNETKGMIPEILDDIPAEAKMYLINAIAFEAEWAEKYEEDAVKEGILFTNANGSTTEVTMLYSKESRYFTLAGGEGFIKPYQGGEYSFVGILPKEGQSATEYLEELNKSGRNFAEAVKDADYSTVYVRIPEFKNDFETEMSDAYKSLGMENPFEQGAADFSEMMEPADGNFYDIWIGKILHKTHIEVDRKGTKAAAVTAVEMDVAGAAPVQEETHTIYLDRPFVYAIVDNETGLPIFLGCQNSMD